MMKIVGDIQTEPFDDGGRIRFEIRADGDGKIVSSISGPGYKPEKPKVGDRVALLGDYPPDVVLGRPSHLFSFRSLQLPALQPAALA